VQLRTAKLGRRSPAFAAVAAVFVVGGLALGCSSPLRVYPVVGRAYDAEEDCLLEEGTLDVIDGTAPADCLEPRCLLTTDTNELFVSAVCVELAGFDDVTDEEPRRPDCEAALLAWDEERYCD
jgi:hypothetical protein